MDGVTQVKVGLCNSAEDRENGSGINHTSSSWYGSRRVAANAFLPLVGCSWPYLYGLCGEHSIALRRCLSEQGQLLLSGLSNTCPSSQSILGEVRTSQTHMMLEVGRTSEIPHDNPLILWRRPLEPREGKGLTPSHTASHQQSHIS